MSDTYKPEDFNADDRRFAELEQHVQIDADSLDNEIVTFTSYFYHVGLNYAQAVSLRDAAKEDVAAFEAELSQQIRQRAVVENEKISEATVEARIKTNSERLDLVDKHIRARLRADRWGVLRETFSQKGYMIKELVELHKINYFGERPVSSTERDEAGTRVRHRAT